MTIMAYAAGKILSVRSQSAHNIMPGFPPPRAPASPPTPSISSTGHPETEFSFVPGIGRIAGGVLHFAFLHRPAALWTTRLRGDATIQMHRF